MADTIKSFALPEKIIEELNVEYFAKYYSKIKNVLDCICNDDKNFDDHIEAARECLKEFFSKYYGDNIVKLLDIFPKIQRALFGFEEDTEKGIRYRDHYVHSFNVFLTGARIISQTVQLCNEDEIEEIFNIQSEPTSVPFKSNYEQKERLFFLWTLISTFHDIGIPVEHLDKIKKGMNDFLSLFDLAIDKIIPMKEQIIIEEVSSFFTNMSNFENLSIVPQNGLYKKSEKSFKYLNHCLIREYGRNNHSVVGAVCLLNSYIKSFLVGDPDKKDKSEALQDTKDSNDGYDRFLSLVLEHDISRAALAIAYHNIDPKTYPKLFHVNFKKLPLTFLLILCDEIQETYRQEGIDYKGIIKLRTFPEIEVKRCEDKKFNITIKMLYNKLSEEEEERIVYQLNTHLKKEGKNPTIKNFQGSIKYTWENIFNNLKSKLQFELNALFIIIIQISYKDFSNVICSSKMDEWED
jgi:hypothetical protein